MSAENNGLTLEGLAKNLETQAQRLQTLERENAELRHEVTALRASGTVRGGVAELGNSDTRRDRDAMSEFEGLVSRRSLLSKAGAAAVAAVAAGMLIHPRGAKANHYDDEILVDHVETHGVSVFGQGDDPGVVAVVNSDRAAALNGRNIASGPGVKGTNTGTGPGVLGNGTGGVEGYSSASGKAGVYGRNVDIAGPGVVGDGKGASFAGVRGNNSGGVGVEGHGKNGVYGLSSTGDGWGAVVGRSTGQGGIGTYGEGLSGVGVKGVGKHGSGGGQGVVGAGVEGSGLYGVWGESSVENSVGVVGRNRNGIGVAGDGQTGVRGDSFGGGYGGRFGGGKAQLMLDPGGSVGKPTSGTHNQGEIYMDSAGTLFVCTAGDGTTVGTWRKVTTTAV